MVVPSPETCPQEPGDNHNISQPDEVGLEQFKHLLASQQIKLAAKEIKLYAGCIRYKLEFVSIPHHSDELGRDGWDS